MAIKSRTQTSRFLEKMIKDNIIHIAKKITGSINTENGMKKRR